MANMPNCLTKAQVRALIEEQLPKFLERGGEIVRIGKPKPGPQSATEQAKRKQKSKQS